MRYAVFAVMVALASVAYAGQADLSGMAGQHWTCEDKEAKTDFNIVVTKSGAVRPESVKIFWTKDDGDGGWYIVYSKNGASSGKAWCSNENSG